MWIKVTLFTSLFILGYAHNLDFGVDLHKFVNQFKECENNKADIAFIIDSSRSIKATDFKKGIDFLVHFVQNYTIDPNHVRVAAVAFGRTIVKESAFGFNKFITKAKTLQALKNIKYRSTLGGKTNTGMAIAYARKEFFANARSTVKKIAIVLTDGRSQQPVKTKTEAKLLKNQEVTIIAIGVGSADMKDELNAIASSPQNVFEVMNYDSLENIIDALGSITCKMTTTTTILQLKAEQCEDNKADIVFIIDSSRSIYSRDFKKGIDFLVHFLQNYMIDPNHVRVAAVAFGRTVVTDSAFGFNKFITKAKNLQALKNIKYRWTLGGKTNTGMAIAYARKEFFAKARPTVKKIAIVLTDGRSQQPVKTKTEAELLKNQGVTIIAIGVGSADMKDELNAIASSPQHVFEVMNYDSLENIIHALRFITCIMTTTPTDLQLKEGQCEDNKADIVFIIDSSRSIYSRDFKKGIDFLVHFLQNYMIDPNHVRVAAVAFGRTVVTDSAFGFNKFITKAKNLQALKNIKYRWTLGGKTNTGMAIAYARKEFFAKARPTVKKIAIVLTDGRSQQPVKTKTEAELLKNQGVTIIAIGVGSADMKDELNAIASSPQHVFEVMNYDSLENIIHALRFITCKMTTTPTDLQLKEGLTLESDS